MISNEIKRCPFCGGVASVGFDESTYLFHVAVTCTVCGARGKTFKTEISPEKGEEELKGTEEIMLAISAWNIRKGDA